jgi:hypothetical protein
MITAPRQITIVKGIKPLHFRRRVAELLSPGASAWVSFDGKKALPVVVTEIDDRHYSVRMERTSRVSRVGNVHSLFLDEVRSTPEAACINCVTS